MEDALKADLLRIKVQQSMASLLSGHTPELARSAHEVSQLRLLVKTSAAEAAAVNAAPLSWTNTSNNVVDVSKNSLKKLKPVTLQHLLLEEALKGGYLILRTLEPAYKIAGITTAVEDSDGNAVLFSVYNFTADPNPDLNAVLPVGTVFILKEPYIKTSASGVITVRCDCPTDMIVLYKGHELFSLAEKIVWKNHIEPKLLLDPVWGQPEPKTASDWKKRGNALYKQDKFEYSIRCYLLGLQNLAKLGDEGPMVQILQSNLSAAYLRLGFFEKAFDFAEKVLVVEPESKKALFRAGRSSYQLRKYQEAKVYFEKCHHLHPDDKDTKIELQKVKNRCCEQENGEFNMHKMFLNSSLHPRQKLDCADYVGPIKVVAIEGKGRGIVAMRDLEPGTLLVVSKALVFAWDPENKVQMMVNVDQTCELGNRQDVTAELAQLIAKNPCTFGPVVYDLFDGSGHVENVPSVLFCDPETKQELIVDVQRLRGILTANSFGDHLGITNQQSSLGSKFPKKFSPKGGSGLFPVPSYFNHSCLANSMYDILNDVMFIRAITYIKADEELFLPYLDFTLSFSERQRLCYQRGFKCFCALCKQDRKLPSRIHDKREGILSKAREIFNQMTHDPAGADHKFAQHQLEILTSKMSDTNSNSTPDSVNVGLLRMYNYLAPAYLINPEDKYRNCERIIECFHNALKIVGFDAQILLAALEKGASLLTPRAFLSLPVFECVCMLVKIYHDTFQFDLKSKWVEILCALEKVHSGGDINVVKLNYGHIEEIL